MSIELRSAATIKHAVQSLQDGDYHGETSLTIRLHTPFFSSTLDDDVKEDLVNVMGSLPCQLKSLEVRPIVFPEDTAGTIWECFLPVEAFTAVMARARNLESIALKRGLILVGSKDGYEKLADGTKGHPSLKTATLLCQGQEEAQIQRRQVGDASEVSLLDAFVLALGGVATLKTLELVDPRLNFFMPTLSDDALAAICSLPRLKKMGLWSFQLSAEHLSSIVRHLQKKDSLEDISLTCHKFCKDRSDALKRLVRQNKSAKVLRFYVESFEDEVAGPSLLGALVRELQWAQCKTLQLTVPAKCLLEVTERLRIMLRGNYNLEQVYLYEYTRSTSGGNYLGCHPSSEKGPEIDFLLKANKAGRGRLFRQDIDSGSSDATTWLTMLNATDYDLNNIYYLVSSNPLKFVELLQNDWGEKQLPDNRTMKKLLRANRRMAVNAIDTGFRQNKQNFDEFKGEIVELIEGQDDHLVGQMKEILEKESAKVVTAFKTEVEEAMSKKIEEATKSFRTSIEEETRSRLQKGEKARQLLVAKVEEQTHSIKKVEEAIDTLRGQMERQSKEAQSLDDITKIASSQCVAAVQAGLAQQQQLIEDIRSTLKQDQKEVFEAMEKKVDQATAALQVSMEKQFREVASRNDRLVQFLAVCVGALVAMQVLQVRA